MAGAASAIAGWVIIAIARDAALARYLARVTRARVTTVVMRLIVIDYGLLAGSCAGELLQSPIATPMGACVAFGIRVGEGQNLDRDANLQHHPSSIFFADSPRYFAAEINMGEIFIGIIAQR